MSGWTAGGPRRVLAVVAIGAVGGWPAGCTPVPSGLHEDTPKQVYCLRGLWDVFSTGLDSLAVEMRERGLAAESLSGPLWPDLAERIEKASHEQSLNGDLVLVGHSFGAEHALRLAFRLQQQGIPVGLMVLIDATTPPPIPSNVARCVHLYIPSPLASLAPDVFTGRPVELAEGNDRTELVNWVVTPAEFGPVNHFNLESNPVVHQVVIDEVLAIRTGPAPGAACRTRP
ncbi:MAG TPA: alpha/beta fold hydrolase [Phycisphaerae bacterium]|nr:alpha/beta fold hydrolase [Phycisphaerae bacterium]